MKLVAIDDKALEFKIWYALGFSERGKSLTKGYRQDDKLMSRHIVEMLKRSGCKVFREPIERVPGFMQFEDQPTVEVEIIEELKQVPPESEA